MGEWLLFLTMLLLLGLGLAAGLGLTQLLFELVGDFLLSPYEARTVWTAWVVRLIAVVLLPVLCAAYVTAALWLVQASTVTRLLLTLPFIAIALPLFLSPLLLWDDLGSLLMAVAAYALLCAAFAGGWAVQLGLLEWRGSETVCTVSGRGEHITPTPDGGEMALYTYALDCAADDAPDEMTSYTPVPDGRIPVVYDPSGLARALPAAELDQLTLTAWIAGGGAVLWTLPSVGNVLFGIPLARNPNAWP
ncbi:MULTISPECIES: hypothetical protein [Streptomyces]|uniref:hypothetical protein n=1 Tax=Streptomyces TaxID=1883 RepID=UPI00148983C7|nr:MULTISPECIES: hypothetical protein [Streptomyces]